MAKKATSPTSTTAGFQFRYVVAFVVLTLLLYVVLPQIGSFRSSLNQLKHADFGWVLVGLGFFFCSILAGAIIYKLLSPKNLKYTRTVVVLLAACFANRLLPAGIGALGVGYRYLRREKLTQSQALAVATLNNLLGFAGNVVLLGVLVLVMPSGLRLLEKPHFRLTGLLIALTVAVIIGLIVLIKVLAPKLKTLAKDMLKQLVAYRKRPAILASALMVSVCLTSCFSLCLWASSRALGVDLSIAQALIVLTISVAVGTVVPSPGGLGGAEAGLIAGLVAYNVPPASALAVALLYRLLTYWAGLVFGAGAFAWIVRHHYI